MTTAPAKTSEATLTIISHNLLRTSTKDWLEPTHLFKRVRGSALSEILAEINNGRSAAAVYDGRRSLLMFDCMLRVIDEPVIASVLQFGTQRFAELQDMFYSALASNKFNALAPSTRVNWARAFYKLLINLRQNFEVRHSSYVLNSNQNLPDELALLFDSATLDSKEVEKLQPYLLTDKNGTHYNVLLKPIIPHLGSDFTNRLYIALREIAKPKAMDTALRDFGTTFARFIEYQAATDTPITEEKLRDPRFVYEMLVAFMTYHFMKKYRMKGGGQEGTLASLQKIWTRYEIYWAELAKKGLVTQPLYAFPEGKRSLSYVKEVRHQRQSKQSENESDSVTHKLITPVPLHLSDDETTHIIFKQISEDFNKTQNWLDSHLDQMWQMYQRGATLSGSDAYVIASDNELVDLLNPKKNSNALVEALRYFKHQHNGYVDTNQIATPAYPDMAARGGVSKRKLAQLLGIPNREDTMALIGYLASVDGRFSEKALATAQLYDRSGNRINAVNSGDSTLTLSVYKDRAGTSGWHDVVISGKAYVHVQRWLQLTTPLRAYMQKNEINGWRNLFIYSSNLGKPAFFTRTSNINSAFRAFAHRNFTSLGELTDIVTIPRIRAQRGVMVFLEKFDIRAMARELGNDEDTTMQHYLPDAIWNYFAVRWIRIFQNLLIVEATRDTPYMARALKFGTARELDEFLKNHALKPLIPKTDEKAVTHEGPGLDDNSGGDSEVDSPEASNVQEIMVAASHAIFSVLLSVRDAVKHALSAGDVVHDKALYWYEFTKRLQNHIESDAFADRGIKKLLKEAALDVHPANYTKAIRA